MRTKKIKKIGNVVRVDYNNAEVYGEIIGNEEVGYDVVYEIKLDTGQIEKFVSNSVTSIYKNEIYYVEKRRKQLIENPFKHIHKSVTLSLESWEGIINNLPDEQKLNLQNIQRELNHIKKIYNEN